MLETGAYNPDNFSDRVRSLNLDERAETTGARTNLLATMERLLAGQPHAYRADTDGNALHITAKPPTISQRIDDGIYHKSRKDFLFEDRVVRTEALSEDEEIYSSDGIEENTLYFREVYHELSMDNINTLNQLLTSSTPRTKPSFMG